MTMHTNAELRRAVNDKINGAMNMSTTEQTNEAPTHSVGSSVLLCDDWRTDPITQDSDCGNWVQALITEPILACFPISNSKSGETWNEYQVVKIHDETCALLTMGGDDAGYDADDISRWILVSSFDT